MPFSKRVLCALGVLLSTFAARADEDPYGDHPRLGGREGRLRSWISRAPSEEVQTPDVITLKGGVKREAYFLNVYGDRFVYYVKETARTWLREEVQRTEVESVDFSQYLDQDPVAPRKVERARKQPAVKNDVLSGVFRASQGRGTRWTASFQSELDKFLEYSEDATDYGTVELESSFVQQVERDLPPAVLPRGSTRGGRDSCAVWPRKTFTRSHEVRAKGKYYLYAPGTVNNEDWVLVLSEVIQSEIDHGRDTSIFTTVIPDETFIVAFSPEKDTFRLAWSNVGGWTWSSLVGIAFERLADAPAWGEDAWPFPRRGAAPPPARRPEARQVLVRGEGGTATLGTTGGWRVKSKLEGWKRPVSRWVASRG